MGAGVPLPMKVNAPAHQKYNPTPSRSGNKPTIQTDGVSLTASPDQDNRSQGTTPATVPGTRIVKMSVFRAIMNDLPLWFEHHQVLTISAATAAHAHKRQRGTLPFVRMRVRALADGPPPPRKPCLRGHTSEGLRAARASPRRNQHQR